MGEGLRERMEEIGVEAQKERRRKPVVRKMKGEFHAIIIKRSNNASYARY